MTLVLSKMSDTSSEDVQLAVVTDSYTPQEGERGQQMVCSNCIDLDIVVVSICFIMITWNERIWLVIINLPACPGKRLIEGKFSDMYLLHPTPVICYSSMH